MKEIYINKISKDDIFVEFKHGYVATDTIQARCKYSPSKLIDVRQIPVTRIRMTCGGGVGGSSWFEYATDMKSIDIGDNFVELVLYDGRKKIINKNYIVELTDEYKVVLITEDRTAWCNYQIRNGNDTKQFYQRIYVAERYVKVIV